MNGTRWIRDFYAISSPNILVMFETYRDIEIPFSQEKVLELCSFQKLVLCYNFGIEYPSCVCDQQPYLYLDNQYCLNISFGRKNTILVKYPLT